jgi:signal transduction histidine kinase/streptogramin lyase
MAQTGPGLGLQQIEQGVLRPVAASGFDSAKLAVSTLFTDREKHLWIGTQDDGIYRFADGQIDRFRVGDGLSGDAISAIYQDREDNVWVATADGLDCFRKTAMVSFSVREGLAANLATAVVADRKGTIWISNSEALDSISSGHVSSLQKRQGLPGGQVTALLEDHAGRLWVGVNNRLSVYERGMFRLVDRGDGAPLGTIRALTEDRENNVWAIALGNPGRLIRITDFSVREDIPVPQSPYATSLAADPEKGIWMGLFSGHLARYRDGRLETFRFTDGNVVRDVVVTPDGAVLGTTNHGVVGWRNGTLRTLTTLNGLPCDGVYAAVFDTPGALWLYTQCGLVRIAGTDLKRWWEHDDAVVEVKVFDALDGVRPGPASFQPKASRSPDGRLWFASDTVAQMLDPAHLPGNTMPPPVHIEQLIADRRSYPVTEAVRLPPLTRDLEIDFVGLSYVTPQRVVFRYRLEGRDKDWQESGNRRQAFYNDLRPGSYRFRVTARNNDGLWNEEGAALDVVVAPAWYQTSWFLAACAIIGIVTVGMIYQLRLRQVARVLNARFDERLAERTRVARDLHDTLLQTVQGSKMVADAALAQRDDPAGMRRAMEQVSMWLGQSSTEGRAAVKALRASTVETNDLAQAFRRAIQDCERQGSLQASLVVTGEPREMHPVVRDEVYRIGYEAIHNACAHSGGSRLEIGLTYSRDLTIIVADNGVGIDPAVASEGKDGHFGLRGMRERAARIGAKLTIVSAPDSGTEIRVNVPGRVIFRKQNSTLVDRIRAQFTSSTSHQ